MPQEDKFVYIDEEIQVSKPPIRVIRGIRNLGKKVARNVSEEPEETPPSGTPLALKDKRKKRKDYHQAGKHDQKSHAPSKKINRGKAAALGRAEGEVPKKEFDKPLEETAFGRGWFVKSDGEIIDLESGDLGPNGDHDSLDRDWETPS